MTANVALIIACFALVIATVAIFMVLWYSRPIDDVTKRLNVSEVTAIIWAHLTKDSKTWGSNMPNWITDAAIEIVDGFK